jgi:DNA/RNA-binding domain of Phe-tRNA-synthetase-like protein
VVTDKSAELWAAIASFSQDLRTRYASTEEARPDLEPARYLYRKIGLDPTKNRPSSEALLRRIIKDKPLFQVNSVVDTCNFCSLQFLLPIGLYDLDNVTPPIVLKVGEKGGGYEGIGKGWINLEGKLAVCDSVGPFGNPSSDSSRTKITASTKNVLFVIFAPIEYDSAALDEHAEFASAKMQEYNGGRLTGVTIY